MEITKRPPQPTEVLTVRQDASCSALMSGVFVQGAVTKCLRYEQTYAHITHTAIHWLVYCYILRRNSAILRDSRHQYFSPTTVQYITSHTSLWLWMSVAELRKCENS